MAGGGHCISDSILSEGASDLVILPRANILLNILPQSNKAIRPVIVLLLLVSYAIIGR